MRTTKKYIFIVLPVLLVCSGFGASLKAATGSADSLAVNEKSEYHFESIKGAQLWNSSNNPAGLGFYDFKNISYVEGFFQKNNGGFVKYYESNNSYRFGVQTESFTKVKNVSMYGKLGYSSFGGNNMTWSGLIYPEDHLVHVADDVPADKRAERYFVSGGLSVPICKKILGGFSIDYDGENLSKMKDLRHKTDFMQLDVKAGFVYQTKYVNIGINYIYEKYYERVAYSRVSTNSDVYNGYYLKGLWFGLSDSWDNPGLHLKESGSDYVPFSEHLNGAAVQAELKIGNFRFMNEFTYKRQSGYVGMGGEKIYNTSYGNIYEYFGKMQLEGGKINHYLTVNTQYRDDVNEDNVFTSEMINGETVIVQYGKNKVYDRKLFTWNAEYNFTWGARYNPSWDIKVGYEHYAKSAVSSLVLPYYYTQEIKYNMGYINARKNFVFNTGMLDVALGADYSNGFGSKLEEHKADNVQADIAEDMKPKPIETLLNKEYEYYTVAKIGGEIGARYSFFINRKNGKGGNIYLDAKYRLLSASKAVYASGTKAQMFRIALGVNF